jgi:hypothetical protein
MINFCAYLESKVLFFENDTNYYYDFQTKKFYPIINNSMFINSEKIEIDTKGLLPKIKNSPDFLIKSDVVKNNNFKVLIKNSTVSTVTNQKEAQYVEINNTFFPLIKESEKIGYIDDKGDYIELSDEDLKSYKVTNKKFYNYYVNLKSSKGKSSSSVDSELNELEGGGEEAAETAETPAEPKPETT